MAMPQGVFYFPNPDRRGYEAWGKFLEQRPGSVSHDRIPPIATFVAVSFGDFAKIV